VDPQAGPLGEHQQLGVEEPAAVLHQRQQARGDVLADRLEAALGVREAGRQRAAQQQVVAAGDQLALGAADHPRAGGEPAADRQVRVPGDQRRHQRQQRGQVGGQVDVHIGEHRRGGGRPRRPQRPAAALLLQVDDRDLRQLPLEGPGEVEGGVGAGVVGDRDAEGVGEGGGQVGVQAAHAPLQVGLLVVDGDRQVEDGPAAGVRAAAGGPPAGERGGAHAVAVDAVRS
jgi:hypothetical protein